MSKRHSSKFESIVERFVKGFRVLDNECWEWISAGGNAYGHMFYRYKNHRAHRESWKLFHGPIPDGLFVLYRCDYRSCVNPDHLFLGTAADNSQDMVSKGRQSHKGAPPRIPIETVIAVRGVSGTYAEIASLFGISQMQAWRIKNRVQRKAA